VACQRPRGSSACCVGVALGVRRARVAVLSAVHDHPHADTESVIGVVREDLGEVSDQAVYDVLALTAAGLVRRIQPTGSVVRPEAWVGDNHHHVVCRSCGAIAGAGRAVGYTPCLTAPADSGCEIDEAEVTHWGRCPGCVAVTSAVADRGHAAIDTSGATAFGSGNRR